MFCFSNKRAPLLAAVKGPQHSGSSQAAHQSSVSREGGKSLETTAGSYASSQVKGKCKKDFQCSPSGSVNSGSCFI